ncbi:MAG TPA: GntR family transcriptional regulator [Prolixibacteraceae bacterium]|nr:GntR family transcriptional regulator [Prolixibacteraceae bacterium]
MLKNVKINSESEIPKYRQIVDLFISDIEAGIFKQGQRIPSINETSEELLLSRDTVEKAYVYMKKKGILLSVRGKGYYVNHVNVGKKLKIYLLFNKLSNYKRSIYYSFIKTMGAKASVDVGIYNYDLEEFETLIDNNLNNYDYFVILPHFRDENVSIANVIKKIPHEKVLIVDRFMDELKNYPVVYQEYDKDIQSALTCGLDLLQKYSRLNLVFPRAEYYPPYIARGFRIFCQIHGFDFTIIDRIEDSEINRGEAYIIVSDDDLYAFIRKVQQRNWILGQDCGVVAYNENQVKEILCDGITTISTNHEEIGHLAAKMILTKKFERVKSPFKFIRRNSL